jgi:hypothetical protein
MSYWTSLTFLTWYISVMAQILLGFASMQRLLLMYPKGALFRVQLDVEAPEVSNGFF